MPSEDLARYGWLKYFNSRDEPSTKFSVVEVDKNTNKAVLNE